MSEAKNGWWQRIWSGKKGPEVTGADDERTGNENKPTLDVDIESSKEELKEKIIEMAKDLVESGWQSSLLSPDRKYESISDYLEKELNVKVELDEDELAEFTEIDKVITYKWQNVLKNQAKKWGVKTTVGAGIALTVGGIMGFFTGGASWGLIGMGIGGSAAGRGIVESLKAVSDIYGKGKEMRIELAKNYLLSSLEAQKIAREVLKDVDDPERFNKSAEKLIDMIYTNQPKDAGEAMKNISKSKEELSGYEKRWNVASEIVSIAGGIGAASAYGMTKGVEKIAEEKLELVAKRGLEIDLNGDGLKHAVEKTNDGWHYVIKQIDINEAIAKLGKHWTTWFHQVGGKTAEVGQLHAGFLSEEAINNVVNGLARQEIGKQLVAQVAAGTFLGSGLAWKNENDSIVSKLKTSNETNADKEIIKKYLSNLLDDEKTQTDIESSESQKEDLLGNAEVGDVFMFDNSDGKKVRIEVTKIDSDKVELSYKVIEPDYLPKDEITININDAKKRKADNKKLIVWNNHKEYSYKDWQKIERFLNDHEEMISGFTKGSIINFRKDADLTAFGLDKKVKYEIYMVDKDKNKIFIYDKDKGYTQKDIIRKNLNEIVGLVKDVKVNTEYIDNEKEINTRIKVLISQFEQGKKIINFRKEVSDDFFTDLGLKKDKNYEIEVIDTNNDIMKVIEIETGDEKEIELSKIYPKILSLREGKDSGTIDADDQEQIEKNVEDKIKKRYEANDSLTFPPDYRFTMGQIITYGGEDYIITEDVNGVVVMVEAKKDVSDNFDIDRKGFYKNDQNSIVTISKEKLAVVFEGYKGRAKIRIIS